MDILTEVRNLLDRRPDIEPHVLGSYTRLAPSTVRHFLSGQKDAGPAIIREFQRVLRLIEQGDILQPGQDPVTISEQETEARQKVKRSRDFYLTETVKRVGQVLNYCSDQAAIGVVTGDYGVGKTEALQYWRSHAGAKISHLMFEFDEFSSRNVVDFVNQIAEALEVPSNAGHNFGGLTFRAICAALCEEPMLIVFDQCESIQPRIFQIIRQIWDRTRYAGVGIVLLGSPLLVDKMRSARMKDVGALTSRVGIWAALRGVQKEEAADIVRQEGIRTIEDDAFALLWRATGGSMRRLMAVTDLLVAKHAGKAVTVRTIEGVSGNLWGVDLALQRIA